MWCRKVKIFQLILRIDKPVLQCDCHISFLICDRRRLHQLAIVCIAGDADQIVLVGLIQQGHFLIHTLLFQVFVFNDTVIHRIGDPAHTAQIILQIDCCLFQQLAGVFPHQCLLFLGKLLVKQDTQKTQTAYRNDRK